MSDNGVKISSQMSTSSVEEILKQIDSIEIDGLSVDEKVRLSICCNSACVSEAPAKLFNKDSRNNFQDFSSQSVYFPDGFSSFTA